MTYNVFQVPDSILVNFNNILLTQLFLSGKPGKLVFISGPSGAGKSTVAGMIAKKHEWIHYEGDGFLFGFNPYVFPNESQVDARSDKPALIGKGMFGRYSCQI